MALKEIDLHAPLRPIEYLVPDLVPLGFVTFLGAQEGVGKTTVLSALAWQLTRPAGQGRFLGHPVMAGPVVYLNTDAADGESRPVRFWLEKHRAAFPDGDMGLLTVLENTGIGLTPDELKALLVRVRDKGATALIIDSFMGSFPGLDSNQLGQVMPPMLALRDFAAQSGVAVIVADHLPKKAVGEKVGDRGIMGSVGKSGQARAIHVLTAAQLQGRPILRWFVRKQNFGASGYAFGVEVVRELDETGRPAVRLEPCDLPPDEIRNETRGGMAASAVKSHLEASGGGLVKHADLKAIAASQGSLQDRAAREAVTEALEQLGGRLETLTLPRRGAPKAYRLKDTPEPDCQTATNNENTVQDSASFVADPDCHKPETATNQPTEQTMYDPAGLEVVFFDD